MCEHSAREIDDGGYMGYDKEMPRKVAEKAKCNPCLLVM